MGCSQNEFSESVLKKRRQNSASVFGRIRCLCLAACIVSYACTGHGADSASLSSPTLSTDVAESVVSDTRILLNAGPRVNEAQASIDRLEAKKALIVSDAASAIGPKPVFDSSVVAVKQDEFETASEYKARLKQVEARARREYEERLAAWEDRQKRQASLRDKRLNELAREKSSLTSKLAEVVKERDQQQRTNRNYEGWLLWGSQPTLPRYDVDSSKFPGISLHAESVASPEGAVIVYRGTINGREIVILSDKKFARGDIEHDFYVADRSIARTFKQEWADGKVMIASSCRCELKSTHRLMEVVVKNAVTKTETISTPDYAGFAGSVLKGVINQSAPGSFHPSYENDGYNALHRKQTKVTELQPKEAFAADAIILSVAIDTPKVFRIMDGQKTEPYAGVELQRR